ncbi:helix-turn-helix transcriptional regulator, partial [Adlercreutzia equolifaciens]|uniref:helix-turn-helix transcriptional regulator n=1 Tax=Adlercreutzia equolifaciens TaxID=446660 RepID=UPI00242AB278
ILSFAYGMLDVVAMASPVADASLSGFASQVGGLVAIVAFIVYINRGARRYAVLLNVALAVVATGVLFLPFLPQGYSVTLVVLAHMGWEVALLVIYTLAIGAARGSDASLLGWSAIVFALPRPALLAGSLAAAFLAAEGQFAFTQMVVVAFALLYLIIMGVAVLRNREQRAYQRALRRKDELIRRYREAQRDLQELACEELAAAHGLTKRETELLRLLAQGRDASYVERTLFLSRNTVKSYRKSLYAKLGVHSQQELIDRVNAAMPVD